MNTITDAIYGARRQYASAYQTPTSGNFSPLSSSASGQSTGGVDLQKLLTDLDKIEAALAGFTSGSGRAAKSSADGQTTPATSARIASTEDINADTPSHAAANIVKPANAFNGNGRNSPNFEQGTTVGEGSFLVNGVEIVVNSNSSIYSVLTSINASAANVSASYRSAEERVVLTHNQLGASSTIDLSDDSSGFLRATKLDGAVIENGVDAGVVDNTDLKSRSYRTANMLDNLDKNLAALFEPSAHYQSITLKNEIQKIVENMQTDFGNAQLKKSGIEFSNSDDELFRQNKSTRRRLVHSLQNGDRFTLNALTADKDGKQGLIPSLKKLILEHVGSANSGYRKGSVTNLRA